MKRVFNLLILTIIKYLSRIFYRFEVTWVGDKTKRYKDLKLIAFINHTSLFEPIYLGAKPFSFLWHLSKGFIVPGADKTMKRPIVGKIFKLIYPKMASISRKRDEAWKNFLQTIKENSIVGIAPEGRMMRKTGLDALGKKMYIKGGIVDIISRLNKGKILIAYSGGLHHVQHPGDFFPKIFKKLKISFEVIDLKEYKEKMFKAYEKNPILVKNRIIEDLERRKRLYTPTF